MQAMKKVEFVIEAVYTEKLRKLLLDYGIEAFTLIKDVEGFGGHGLKLNDNVSSINSNDYFFTAIDETQFLRVKEPIRAFIVKYGGKCFVSDTMMIFKP